MPRYFFLLSEISNKVMLVNYSVTMAGLSDQLLNVVVANEYPVSVKEL